MVRMWLLVWSANDEWKQQAVSSRRRKSETQNVNGIRTDDRNTPPKAGFSEKSSKNTMLRMINLSVLI